MASDNNTLSVWVSEAIARGASDLHLVPGYRPTLRLHGRLTELDQPVLTDELARSTLLGCCTDKVRNQFENQYNADFASTIDVAGKSQRIRVNLFVSGPHLGACIRMIPDRVPDLIWAGFPADLADRLAHFRNGLVLVTGITGAGKSTTLAMILQLLNEEGGNRILTLEEPIEYVFRNAANSIITQREVGTDVASFADGLKYGLRQDPDVILVGEIRDRDTAQMALSAAETGHLVFSTLHTRDAKGAISRYTDLFPQNAQGEIRSQLAMSLRAVISQHLLPSLHDGDKRQLALEILFNNAPIASAIRFGKLESIDTNILTGRSSGMVTLDESVKRLLLAGQISRQTAERFVSSPDALR